MIDHVTLRVRDLEAAKDFYRAALAPLGYALQMEFPDGAGFAVGGKPDFWLFQDPEARPQHLAFVAPDRAEVDAFYAAALAAGGRDNGPAGLRTEYHPNYYAAFVLDGTGHNVEAVTHRPPGGVARSPKAPAATRKKRMVKGPKGLAKKVTAGRAPPAGKKKPARGAKGVAKKRMAKGPKG
jgi:catechol 2,3-dioxygenase-like lactoylglutathione lyase family enzyme